MHQLAGERYSCGYLIAPENYQGNNQDSQTNLIKIPFLVIFADESEAEQHLTPVLVTGGGGPGSPQMGNKYQYLADDTFEYYEAFSVDNGRTLIIFENRGVGYSDPELECHYQPELLNEDYWPKLEAANEHCGSEYRTNGTDLSQYNTRNAALDIELFRQLYAMQGFNTSQLNLYGISYGTHIAMHYEQLFPDNTRSLVLDSVVYNELNASDNLFNSLANGQRSLNLVFEKCRASSDCTEALGADLEAEFYSYLSGLDSQEASLTVDWPNRSEPVSIPLSGSLVVATLHSALYSGDSIASVPAMIRNIINNSYDKFTAHLGESNSAYDFRSPFSDLAFLTYLCHDQDYATTAKQPVPEHPLFNYWDIEDNKNQMLDFCTEFNISAQPYYSQPYQSDTPVLMLSGELDPVTPPSNATKAGEKYSYHWDFVFDNVSHDVISHSSCARHLASWFVYHVDEDLDVRREECEVEENTIAFELE
jgi:pimeloyl-ACP methyl ester carboxylesterase